MWQLVLISLMFAGVTGRSLIDLTHTFDENAPKYPLKGFGVSTNFSYYKLKTMSEKWYPDGQWVSLKYIEFYEHMGTHMDAPFHFGSGRDTMDEIPVERLVGPGVNINVREKVLKDQNYAVTVGDIKEYEARYGRIPRNAIVMMNSGWNEKYDNSNLAFGTDDLSNSSTFNFPGWSYEACKFLLSQRQISVLGVDTPSTDPANTPTYICHRYLQPNNVPLLEYVANLDAMPAAGSTIVLGALKHRGGTGGQVRIICIIDDDERKSGSRGAHNQFVLPTVFAMILWVFRNSGNTVTSL